MSVYYVPPLLGMVVAFKKSCESHPSLGAIAFILRPQLLCLNKTGAQTCSSESETDSKVTLKLWDYKTKPYS